MSERSKQPKISLKILVDKEKNKVVLVEACKDFVEVLFGFLKLQMGTIVRLVKKQSQQTEVGCFSNIYQSVLDLKIDNFLTKACQHMLLYPRGLNDVIFRNLKLNINDTIEASKYFLCRCRENNIIEVGGDPVDGVFFYGQPSFIITDNMVVQPNSTDVFLKVIKDQGYADVGKLNESLLVIGSEEVLTLLDCLFSSDTPLTDAFLRKQSSRNMTRFHKTMTHGRQENRNDAESDLLTFNVVFRKQDKKFVLETSGDTTVYGCIGNLFRSFKELSFDKNTKIMSMSNLWYYMCQEKLSDINTLSRKHMLEQNLEKLNRTCKFCSKSVYENDCKRFVKGNMKFIVSDDLIITPLSSSLTIGYLKKLQLSLDDVDMQ